MGELLHVDVIYADEAGVFKKSLQIESGATVADAVRVSGIAADLGESGIDPARIGVFGRVVSSTTALRDGDRVEIYRPLKIDPKEARRRRAKR
ncbi:MAG TPA: RnfH family protein [Rudaea sp.]|nr:RnfH family protein [Rudaea sp.]